MKFTLTYDGELRSNGDPGQKWEIRKHLAPQLEELWRIATPLCELRKNPYFSIVPGTVWMEIHHSAEHLYPSPQDETNADPSRFINLIEPIRRGSRSFFPLVRDSLALKCFLKITFLRREEPGRVYQGGDLDNRLKTLFDALAAPNVDQLVADATVDDPIYCLLEDDALICGFSIETHRLLARPNASRHDVHLVIEVDTRVTLPRSYNHRFLGD